MKRNLRTVRFSPEEASLVDRYLKKNRLFESFSSLARVATLSFIQEGGLVHLNRVEKTEAPKRPRFLWDYDLTEVQVREILSRPGLSDKKRWLIERILSQARFDETLSHLTVAEIEKTLPTLRLPPKIRERWQYAIERWNRHG